jgi:myotubularin-related protein 9
MLLSPSDTHQLLAFIGTFLGICEAERISMKLAERTVSLWSYLNRPDVLQSLLNPMYDPNNRVIWPSVAPMSLVSKVSFHM